MITGDTQKLRVSITFVYDAKVFEEDPQDVFEIARLEQVDLNTYAPEALDSLVGLAEDVVIKVDPVIAE